jgi:hypothetical protein
VKWIGQHIYDLISRFRSDVYLEDISTGTIVSGGHLGLDSNNKIVKAVDGGGDLTSIVAGGGLNGTSLTGPIPTLYLDAQHSGINLIHNETLVVGRAAENQIDFATENKIKFKTNNANQVEIIDGAILPITHNDIDLGGEAELHFKDLWLRGNANISGNVSGTWTGAVIPSAKLDADTAHLTTNQTFTGVKTFNEAINKKSLNFIFVSNRFFNSTADETYFSLGDSDRDVPKGSEDGIGVVAVMPCNGILRQVEMVSSSNLSGISFTYRLYRIPSGTAYTSEILVATVAASAGAAGNTNATISLVTDPGDGTNDITYETGYSATTMFTKGDRALFSLQSNSDASGTPKINTTFCFELDESTI